MALLVLRQSGGGHVLVRSVATWTLVTHPGHLPGGRWAAWVSNWSWLLFFVPFLIFVPLLFPDGPLASRQWRPVAWAAAVALGLAFLSTALAPGDLGNSSLEIDSRPSEGTVVFGRIPVRAG